MNDLAAILAHRARAEGDRVAYTFLADGAADARSLTWAELERRASGRAAAMQSRGLVAGDRVLLALPSGLAFVESLMACWLAGATAVPVSLPRHQRTSGRLHAVVADADARFAIGDGVVREWAGASPLTWLGTDEIADERPTSRADAAIPAVLQYTSGSTGTPRGVVVTHANLIHNAGQIARACGHDSTTTIGGWLPLFHDMGLVGLVIEALVSGARCVFMAPERFLMRPWLWLQMISDHRVRSSPAPNFAFDLCVDRIDAAQRATLDLSGWHNALNGSEPVRPATLARFAATFAPCGFRPETFFPCYGLAEATLFVTGPTSGPRRALRRDADGAALADGATDGHVGCGAPHGETRVAIVDPQTLRRVDEGAVGEIWIAGPSVAAGYWRDADATARTFGATLAGEEGRWLRTGDLGRFADGELFVTGRLKELIIVAGRNLFPVDVERTAESANAAVATSGVAAFAADVDGVERLIVAGELRRDVDSADVLAIARQVRAAVALEHEVTPHDVVVLRAGALPRTTSGKLNRTATRDAYLSGTLERWEARRARAAS